MVYVKARFKLGRLYMRWVWRIETGDGGRFCGMVRWPPRSAIVIGTWRFRSGTGGSDRGLGTVIGGWGQCSGTVDSEREPGTVFEDWRLWSGAVCRACEQVTVI